MLATTATSTVGHGGDDREQSDDLHVQARAGAAAPARLHHDPDFTRDDGEQQQPGHDIAEQQFLDHDLWTGAIGVRSASTRKVAVAESNAMPTATAPISREATGIGAAASLARWARPDRQSSWTPETRDCCRQGKSNGARPLIRPQ